MSSEIRQLVRVYGKLYVVSPAAAGAVHVQPYGKLADGRQVYRGAVVMEKVPLRAMLGAGREHLGDVMAEEGTSNWIEAAPVPVRPAMAKAVERADRALVEAHGAYAEALETLRREVERSIKRFAGDGWRVDDLPLNVAQYAAAVVARAAVIAEREERVRQLREMASWE